MSLGPDASTSRSLVPLPHACILLGRPSIFFYTFVINVVAHRWQTMCFAIFRRWRVRGGYIVRVHTFPQRWASWDNTMHRASLLFFSADGNVAVVFSCLLFAFDVSWASPPFDNNFFVVTAFHSLKLSTIPEADNSRRTSISDPKLDIISLFYVQ